MNLKQIALDAGASQQLVFTEEQLAEYTKQVGMQLALANRKQELKQTADTARLDWLNNNVFSRENLDFQGKLCKEYWMWVFFAPIGVQGDVRTMLDRARGVKNV